MNGVFIDAESALRERYPRHHSKDALMWFDPARYVKQKYDN